MSIIKEQKTSTQAEMNNMEKEYYDIIKLYYENNYDCKTNPSGNSEDFIAKNGTITITGYKKTKKDKEKDDYTGTINFQGHGARSEKDKVNSVLEDIKQIMPDYLTNVISAMFNEKHISKETSNDN